MKLNELKDKVGARKARTRVGRGIGSGKGKTGGRGVKGQKSRSGVAIKGFEGGQMPLHRRLPKHGFTNIFRKHYQAVNVGRLQIAIDSGRLDAAKEITEQILKESGVVTRLRDGVRLLASGELKSKITIVVAGASKGAIAAVEKAGGKVTIRVLAKTQDEDAPAKKAKGKKAKPAKAEAQETAAEKTSDTSTDADKT
ncbi:MAG: 50S ribosomal protein L15 [Rhodospirillaceae bacterium]|jgi:large subunit ribosomal protein L15|nr:50S ribosomal protein L15 [Rhodospirillaceae bacterium]